ncbi:hypothetical protein MMC11_000528 [Xylographa trunciseda]|nr:hypothetical protein [Xylographa trunciseda]
MAPITRGSNKRKLAADPLVGNHFLESVPETPIMPDNKRRKGSPASPTAQYTRKSQEPEHVKVPNATTNKVSFASSDRVQIPNGAKQGKYTFLGYPGRSPLPDSTFPPPRDRRTPADSHSRSSTINPDLRSRFEHELDVSRSANRGRGRGRDRFPFQSDRSGAPSPESVTFSSGDRHRARNTASTPLPELGAALKRTWAAKTSAGGHRLPPEWKPDVSYNDGHVFSDGTFISGGRLCKPLAGAPPPRKPARPKSNFAAFEAIFGNANSTGAGFSDGVLSSDPRAAAPRFGPRFSMLSPDPPSPRAAKARVFDHAGRIIAHPRAPGPSRQRDRPRQEADAFLEGVAAGANSARALGQEIWDQPPNPFTAPRRELLRAGRAASKHRPRHRAGAGSTGSRTAAAGRRRPTDAVCGGAASPLAEVFAQAEARVAAARVAAARAGTGPKENPFSRVRGRTVPLRRRAGPVREAVRPLGRQKQQAFEAAMRRELGLEEEEEEGAASPALAAHNRGMDEQLRRVEARGRRAEARAREEGERERRERRAERRRRRAEEEGRKGGVLDDRVATASEMSWS